MFLKLHFEPYFMTPWQIDATERIDFLKMCLTATEGIFLCRFINFGIFLGEDIWYIIKFNVQLWHLGWVITPNNIFKQVCLRVSRYPVNYFFIQQEPFAQIDSGPSKDHYCKVGSNFSTECYSVRGEMIKRKWWRTTDVQVQ